MNALVWRGSGVDSFVVSLRFGGAGFDLAGDPCPAPSTARVLVAATWVVALGR